MTQVTQQGRPGSGPVARIVLLVLAATMLLGLGQRPAVAHPLSTTAVLLDLHDDRVEAQVQLPIDRLGIALDEELGAQEVLAPTTLPRLREYVRAHLSVADAPGGSWATRVGGGRVEVIDDVDHLVLDAVLTPSGGDVGAFDLHYDAIIERLVSHKVFVAARRAGATEHTSLGLLSWQQQEVRVDPTELAAPGGFGSTVRLGVEHISEGSDHLLFLVMLLLPVPALAQGRRWVPRPDVRRAVWRVVQVATAFAVGHTVTLALGAVGLVHLPARVVESGIALSVLVSAVHAVRPLVRRGEVLIAAGFGLLHGLAFATLLAELSLARADLVRNLLGFNLGIELTQLAVIALLLPSLLVLSRTRAYPAVRTTAAGIGAALACAWFAERVGLLERNHLEPLADVLVDHPLPLAAGLALLALAAFTLPLLSTARTRTG